jgi:hypothetical protein
MAKKNRERKRDIYRKKERQRNLFNEREREREGEGGCGGGGWGGGGLEWWVNHEIVLCDLYVMSVSYHQNWLIFFTYS